jgi:hypothetical protein
VCVCVYFLEEVFRSSFSSAPGPSKEDGNYLFCPLLFYWLRGPTVGSVEVLPPKRLGQPAAQQKQLV